MFNVLLVGDDINILKHLMNSIKWSLLGINEVHFSENGIRAIQVLSKRKLDIIVTDIIMPGMNGIELAKYVHDKYPEIKIIFVSESFKFEYMETAMEYGVIRYLIKPVDLMELTESLYKCKVEILKKHEEENTVHQLTSKLMILPEKLDCTTIQQDIFSVINNMKRTQQSKKKHVMEAVQYVGNNFRKDLKINNLSNKMNLSPNYLSHIFREISGETFCAYINKIRIEKAKELLNNFDYTLFRVAREVGYHDEKYFLKVFKRYVGSTPTQFRNPILDCLLQQDTTMTQL